jgi:hypothetical protein
VENWIVIQTSVAKGEVGEWNLSAKMLSWVDELTTVHGMKSPHSHDGTPRSQPYGFISLLYVL